MLITASPSSEREKTLSANLTRFYSDYLAPTPRPFLYISAIFIKFFGMGISVLRSISVVSALISIIVFYKLLTELKVFKSRYALLVTTFFFAISPWMVFNARLGYEVTLAFTLFNIGVYFLYKAFERPVNFVWASVFFSLATYTAHTQRFLVPIFLFFYFVIFAKAMFTKRNKKHLITALLVTLLIQIPHFTVIKTPAFWVKNQRLLVQPNRIVANIVNQTFSYLSPTNLFYEAGDIDMQHTIPELSVMYNWMVVFYLIGLFVMFMKIKGNERKFFMLLFFSSIIPAVLSGEFLSIQRALPFLLPLMLVIGLGIDYFFNRFNSKLVFVTSTLLLFYSFTLLLRSYFILFPVERANAWNYGYDQVSEYIRLHTDLQFVVDNTQNPRNYILLLYFLNYPPELYQNEVDEMYKVDYYKSLPPEDTYKFGNIEVRAINWESDSYHDQIIVGPPLAISENQAKDHFLERIFEIEGLDKNTIFNFYKTNPDKKCKTTPAHPLCNI